MFTVTEYYPASHVAVHQCSHERKPLVRLSSRDVTVNIQIKEVKLIYNALQNHNGCMYSTHYGNKPQPLGVRATEFVRPSSTQGSIS